MDQIKIIIEPEKKIIFGQKEDNLANLLKLNGLSLGNWCQMKGICGKCVVEVIEGEVEKKNEKEKKFAQIYNWPDNYRLACQIKIKGNMKIRIPEKMVIKGIRIQEKGRLTNLSINPNVKRYLIIIKKKELTQEDSMANYLRKKLGKKKIKIGTRVINELSEIINNCQKNDKQERNVAVIVYEDREIIKISEKPNYMMVGVALDLGTTTIVGESLNIETGEVVARESEYNWQIKYGLDVISRISYATLGRLKLEELKETVIEEINVLIDKMARKINLTTEDFLEMVVAGNTTMNHLFLGIPVDSLAQAPFLAAFSDLPPIKAAELGLKINPEGRIYIVPNIKSFVGGDISAGLLAANFFDGENPAAFIDLGTNGEIAIKKDKEIMVTSTAAGPAFEGANLSCGLPAIAGAISRARLDKGKIQIETIDNLPAKGICGSGLIDLLALFLQRGDILPSGKIAHHRDRINLQADIFLTQEDIRQAQLACAAIKTGFKLLLQKMNLQPDDLKVVYLAGGFGQEISIENSQAIGLLPRLDPKKVIFLGNASLAGARLLLINKEQRQKLLSFLKKIKYISLANQKEFQAHFIEALSFEAWP